MMKKDYIKPTTETLYQLIEGPICDGSVTTIPNSEQEGDYEDYTINAKEAEEWELWSGWKDVLDDTFWHPFI